MNTKSFYSYLKSLGLIGLIMMALNIFTGLGAFEFYIGIPILKNFPTFVWLLLLIVGLISAPYLAYKKQAEMIINLKRQRESAKGIVVIEAYHFDFGEPSNNGYPNSNVSRILRVQLGVTAIPTKRLEAIQLQLLGKLISCSDSKPEIVGNLPSGKYYYYEIPDSLKQGKYTIILVAIVEGIKHESQPYEIDVPKV